MTLSVDISVQRRRLEVTAELEVESGERLSLFGPSGAGKSSLLESMCGLVPNVRGHVTLDRAILGTLAAAREARVSLVRQPTLLFPHLTVEENVLYGLPRRSRARESVAQLLSALGLEGLERARPLALSGGQRQRVALARAVHRPFRLLLLDEPFSAIDGPTRTLVREHVESTVEERQAIAVLVSHDLPEAQAFGHRLAVMDGGRVAQVGLPSEVVRSPLDERVAELCGYVGFLDAAPGLDIPLGKSAALHPDRVRLGAFPNDGPVLSGRIRRWRPTGPRFELDVELSNATFRPSAVRRTATPAWPACMQVVVDSPAEQGTDIDVTVVSPPLVTSVAGRGHEEGSCSARIPTAI